MAGTARVRMIRAFITLSHDHATLAIAKDDAIRAAGDDDATHGKLRALRAVGENKWADKSF